MHLNCENAANGTGCVSGNMEAGDFYDIDLSPSCDADGNFAGLAEPNAALLDSLPVTGSKAQTTARLSNKQFVCILATAHTGQQSDYYYVAAIPPTSVSACRGKPICNLYGERPIEFISQHKQGKICTLTSDARPEGDCAQGWIEAQKLDVFSDGI
ncbi:hypothetical protein J7373_01705 [Xanthomonas sp. A2111]|nr:hypothetical protein [Xanthomonas sp. A2111]